MNVNKLNNIKIYYSEIKIKYKYQVNQFKVVQWKQNYNNKIKKNYKKN